MEKKEKAGRIISNLLTFSVILWGGFSGIAAYLGLRLPVGSSATSDEISPGIVYNSMEERKSPETRAETPSVEASYNAEVAAASEAEGASPDAGGGGQVLQAAEPKAGRININTATSEMLQSLKGVGPSKASGIIEYRNTYGAFVAIEEIKEVKGIGEKTFENIKDFISVE